jgi:hypothetical protein
MAIKWNLETDVNNKTMEDLLIEAFGCISFGKKAAKIHTGSEKKRIKTEFYLAGNAMETMLIEVFGCNSLDGNAIKIEKGKVRKRINRAYPDSHSDNQDMIYMSVNG